MQKAHIVPIGIPDTLEAARELAGRIASALLDDITADIRSPPPFMIPSVPTIARGCPGPIARPVARTTEPRLSDKAHVHHPFGPIRRPSPQNHLEQFAGSTPDLSPIAPQSQSIEKSPPPPRYPFDDYQFSPDFFDRLAHVVGGIDQLMLDSFPDAPLDEEDNTYYHSEARVTDSPPALVHMHMERSSPTLTQPSTSSSPDSLRSDSTLDWAVDGARDDLHDFYGDDADALTDRSFLAMDTENGDWSTELDNDFEMNFGADLGFSETPPPPMESDLADGQTIDEGDCWVSVTLDCDIARESDRSPSVGDSVANLSDDLDEIDEEFSLIVLN